MIRAALLVVALVAAPALAQQYPSRSRMSSAPDAVVSPATGPGSDTCTGNGCAIGPAGMSTDGGIAVATAAGVPSVTLTNTSGALVVTAASGLNLSATTALNFAGATNRITWAGGNYCLQTAVGALGCSAGFSVNTIANSFSATAPTITSACTSPTVTHGTATSFQIDVGTTCAAVTAVVLGLPTSGNGWSCDARHKTVARAADGYLECAGDTTTAITCTHFVRTTGIAGAFTDADDIVISCTGR